MSVDPHSAVPPGYPPVLLLTGCAVNLIAGTWADGVASGFALDLQTRANGTNETLTMRMVTPVEGLCRLLDAAARALSVWEEATATRAEDLAPAWDDLGAQIQRHARRLGRTTRNLGPADRARDGTG